MVSLTRQVPAPLLQISDHVYYDPPPPPPPSPRPPNPISPPHTCVSPAPLIRSTRSRATVAAGGAAAKAGVRVHDTVASIDGNSSSIAYKDLIGIIGAVGRPVVMGFQRSGGGGGGGGGAGGAGARGQEAGPFQRAQDAARRKIDGLKGPPQVCGGAGG